MKLRNIILLLLCLFLFGCKERAYQYKVNAYYEEYSNQVLIEKTIGRTFNTAPEALEFCKSLDTNNLHQITVHMMLR